MVMSIEQMTTPDLVGLWVQIDMDAKEKREELNAIKAEIQARAAVDMEDHNVRSLKYYGPSGSVTVTDSMSLDILNPDKLKETISEGVWNTKVKEVTETKYKCDTKFEKMLKAVFNEDYTFEIGLKEFLQEMPLAPDEKQVKVLLKKLKGDFVKDKETLCAVFDIDRDTDLDVELYYIYKIKNAELIRSFLPEDCLDETLKRIREAVFVEKKTSIGLEYDKEKR